MSVSSLPYIGFVDGASHNTQNLASISWAIYAPTNELISLHGVFLGHATKNIAEYNAVIELLTDVVSLGIYHLIVRLDSQLVVIQLSKFIPSGVLLY
jgi:ribonuclease HI